MSEPRMTAARFKELRDKFGLATSLWADETIKEMLDEIEALHPDLAARDQAVERLKENRQYWADACKEAQQFRDSNAEALRFAETEVADLRQQLDSITKDHKLLKAAVNEDAEGLECLPGCDSYGHAEFCPVSTPGEAYKHAAQQLAAAQAPGAFDAEVFYNLMQIYRHSPIADQAAVIVAFEAVKQYVNVAAQAEEKAREDAARLAGIEEVAEWADNYIPDQAENIRALKRVAEEGRMPKAVRKPKP